MLQGLMPPEKDQLCAFIKNAVDQLDKADMKILQESLADQRWNHSALTAALNERGFKCHDDQVRKHRNGDCRCAE